MLAWYFARENNRLNYGDDRLIEIGKTHTVKCAPVLCESGLHGSVQLLDALHYAPGPMLYRVDITRNVQIGADKICGQRRQYLAGFDATSVLRQFARNQALINIEKIKPYCLAGQYELILDWLKTDNPELQVAAHEAADAAAQSALSTQFDIGSAARSALYALYAALSALFAARSAQSALFAARSAAQSAQSAQSANEMLTEMVEAALAKSS